MRALILDNTTPRFVTDYPMPECPPGFARIAVRQAGICSTDIQLLDGLYDFNGVLGHEFVGVVESVGEDTDSKSLLGKTVVGEINIACHQCRYCQTGMEKHCSNRRVLGIRNYDGCFADFTVLPIGNLTVAPSELTLDELVFTEPLAAAGDILEKADVNESDRVAIVGDGRIAQLAARLLLTKTRELIVFGKHQEKLDRLPGGTARSLIVEDKHRCSFHVVVECSGSAAGLHSAMDLVRPAGTIVLKSTCSTPTQLDGHRIVVNEVRVVGSRCGNFGRALTLMQALKDSGESLADLIDARFPVDKAIQAFSYARKNKSDIKIVLSMA